MKRLTQEQPLQCDKSDRRAQELAQPLRRELRLALCKACNFNCFFCHSEGLDRTGAERRLPQAKTLALLHAAMELGYTDITLTGGEPIAYAADDLAYLLDALGHNAARQPPNITVVTNGSSLPASFLRAAREYPGDLKVHVSLHAVTQDAFTKITGRSFPVATVLRNISALTALGVRVKVNTVVLKGLNDGKEAMLRHLETIRDTGASTLKLLELLVTPANSQHYAYFYSEEAIRRDLASLGCTEVSSSLRTQVLAWSTAPHMRVEVTRCTCKLGCAHCAELRDRQFGSDLRYYPCFIQSSRGLSAGSDVPTLQETLSRGDAAIEQYAATYGNDSPILVAAERFVPGTREAFYTTDLSEQQLRSRLEVALFKHRKTRAFRLIHCIPKGQDPGSYACSHVVKFGFASHTPNKFEMFSSDYMYEMEDGVLVNVQTFCLPKPMEVPATTEADVAAFLLAFGYTIWFERDFQVEDYEHQAADTSISVDFQTQPFTLKLEQAWQRRPEVKTLLSGVQAVPITIPFTAWLAALAR